MQTLRVITRSLAQEETFSEQKASISARQTSLPGKALSSRIRLLSIDALRGLVMILMALDHTRLYFHVDSLLFDPLDLTRTTPALFITRWITHFCAPVFVFLAGTSMFLALSRGKSKKQMACFLLTRGLWLIVLELTIIQFAWELDLDSMNAGVVWVLGWSMIFLAGLIFLPRWAVMFCGLLIIVFHNLFDGVRSDSFGSFHWLWTLLHSPGNFKVMGYIPFRVTYPLVPWIGVMAVGFGFGELLLLEGDKRRRWFLGLGVMLILFFIIIRAVNFYGDPHPWSEQQNSLFTFFSFINLEKYPPSLLYLLVTLGPAIALLALFDWVQERHLFIHPLATFGRVPLFYYIVHLFLIHTLSKIPLMVLSAQVFLPANNLGYSLPMVYLIWFAVLLMLYPACRWFADLKKRKDNKWLSYI